MVVTDSVTGKRFEGLDIARAYFKEIPENVITQIIEKDGVMQCAGGFVVESALLKPYVERLQGASDSIMGMPLILTLNLLKKAGWNKRA